MEIEVPEDKDKLGAKCLSVQIRGEQCVHEMLLA
jgi:hypothetical protein